MTPPDAIATRPEESPAAGTATAASTLEQAVAPTVPRAALELVEIPVDLQRVAQGTDDLSRRFLARHDSPVPAHGDDHSPLAGDLRRLGPARRWAVPASSSATVK